MRKNILRDKRISLFQSNFSYLRLQQSVYIFTDASDVGLGAVMKQPQEDGMLHPVAYFLKKLSPTQKKQRAIYLECLAIKEAIFYWQHWLIGKEFTVVSDHKPLEILKLKARTDVPLGDLMFHLSQYNFKIIYSPGKENIEADSLSRNPVLDNFQNTEDILKIVNMVKIEEIMDDQKTNQSEIKNSKNVIEKGGAGAFVAALETGSERKAVVMGKPSPFAIDHVLIPSGLDPKRCLMIGDRCNTDIHFGNQRGMTTLLVETGVHKYSDLEKFKASGMDHLIPSYYTSSVADLLEIMNL